MAVDLGVPIADVGRSLYIASFGHAMTSLSRFSEETVFSILISSSVLIFLWLFSWCIMDIVSFIVFISCHSLRTSSEKANSNSDICLEKINHLLAVCFSKEQLQSTNGS